MAVSDRLVRRVVLIAALAAVLASSALAGASDPASPGDHSVSLNGIELHYRVVGEGPETLVLLHAGTQSGEMFEPFESELSPPYRLVIPDLRGHGRSTNPEGVWDTRQFARDIFALLDRLGVDRVRAIGASAGGMALLHMAIQQPQRLEAAVVVGVGTTLPPSCREILAGTDADVLPEAAWDRLRARHVHGDDQIRALYAWVASLAEGPEDMAFSPSELAKITAPTLVVHGDRDYCFPASMAWDIYRAIPTSYLWVVPNGSHVPITGPVAPQFVATVRAFLAGEWTP